MLHLLREFIVLELQSVTKQFAKPNRRLSHGEYTDPEKEVFFTWKNGKLLLRDTEALGDKEFDKQARELDIPEWPKLGKINFANKTIEFSKENIDNKTRAKVVGDITEIQKVLKDIMRSDKRIDASWKVKGLDKIWGKTISNVLNVKSTLSTGSISKKGDVFGYHGTSAKRAGAILKFGLVPGQFKDVYNDLIAGYSQNMVYLAADPRGAEFYAKRQMKTDEDIGYVVFKVRIPDKNKLFASETGVPFFGGGADELKKVKPGTTLHEIGEVAYEGRIPAAMIDVYTSKPTWKEIVAKYGDPSKQKMQKQEGSTSLQVAIRTGNLSIDEGPWWLYDHKKNELRNEGKLGQVYQIEIAGEILGRGIRSINISDSVTDDVWQKIQRKIVENSFLDEKLVMPAIKPLMLELSKFNLMEEHEITKFTLSDGNVTFRKGY